MLAFLSYFVDLQLIIYMALAAGTSRIKTGPITLHTQTAMHIAQMMTQVCNHRLKNTKFLTGD